MTAVAPMFSIARFVEDVRTISAIGEPVAVDMLPNGRTSLVIRIPEGSAGDVYVVGPRTRAKFKRATGVQRATTVVFKPGWSPSMFGVPANELTDQLVRLDDLWGDPQIALDLVAARSIPAVLERLSRAVAERTTIESTSARLARRAAQVFEGAETRVEAVAQQLGVTARHLRRAFVENIGIGPKEFARGMRLQRAIDRTKRIDSAHGAKRAQDWSAIARDAGYYDQAHLIGEFRDLVGLTPSAFLEHRALAC